jgi:hypothetical protein
MEDLSDHPCISRHVPDLRHPAARPRPASGAADDATAAEDVTALAKKKRRNPVGDVTSVPFQFQFQYRAVVFRIRRS